MASGDTLVWTNLQRYAGPNNKIYNITHSDKLKDKMAELVEEICKGIHYITCLYLSNYIVTKIQFFIILQFLLLKDQSAG